MKPADAAIIAGVHRKTIHLWADRNPDLMERKGRYWIVSEEELRRIMEARKVLKGE